MATGNLGRHKRRGREGRLLGEDRSGGDHKVSCSLWQAAGGALFALLVSSATVSAQDLGASPWPTPAPGPIPLPELIPDAPTTAAPDAEEDDATALEEEEEEERRTLPFLQPEPSLTETLMPDARPELNTPLLFPPDALEGLRRPERAFQVGRFAVSPSAEVVAAYDHIKFNDGGSSDDVSGNLGVGVRARSQFERHSLGFGVNAAISDPHSGNTTTDRIALTSGVDGELELTRRSSLSAEARFARGAQSPEAQEAGAQEEPTVMTAAAAVGYAQEFNRFGWEIAGGINRTEADDGEEAAEQDRTTYTVSPGVNYEISRRLSVFASSAYSTNHYDQSGEGGSRDSQTVRANVGTQIDLGRAFSVELGIGYVGIFFDDPAREDRHVPALTAGLNGAIRIRLDELTLLRLGVSHSTDQTTADNAALVTRTQGFASISRPLTRASAITAGVRLARSDFVDDGRTDHDVAAQLGYSYSLLRNVALNVGYRFSQRFSNNSENEFYRHTVSVGLSASF